jgi:hypothetical protein
LIPNGHRIISQALPHRISNQAGNAAASVGFRIMSRTELMRRKKEKKARYKEVQRVRQRVCAVRCAKPCERRWRRGAFFAHGFFGLSARSAEARCFPLFRLSSFSLSDILRVQNGTSLESETIYLMFTDEHVTSYTPAREHPNQRNNNGSIVELDHRTIVLPRYMKNMPDADIVFHDAFTKRHVR